MNDHGPLIWAVKATVRSASHKAVIMVLASHADDTGFGWPSQKLLAKEACCSERTVRSVLADLETDGFVERVQRRRPNGSFSTDGLQLRLQPAANPAAGQPEANLASGKSRQRQNLHQPAANPAGPEENIPSSLRSEGEGSAVAARATAASDWKARLLEAQGRVNGTLNLTNGSSHTWAALRPLCEPNDGVPCDWDADVLPALDAVAGSLKAKGKQLHGFAHPAIREIAIANRDRRLAGLPDPKEPTHVERTDEPKHYGITASNLAMRDRSNRAALAALRSLGAVGDDGGCDPAEGAEPRFVGRSVVGGA